MGRSNTKQGVAETRKTEGWEERVRRCMHACTTGLGRQDIEE